VDSRSLIKLLEANGWELDPARGKGDHWVYVKGGKHVTLVHPKKDIPKGTLHSILKEAGLDQARPIR
jgi:predicted RNA binding protein YcfA (HicA-like mRNA interferase family)